MHFGRQDPNVPELASEFFAMQLLLFRVSNRA